MSTELKGTVCNVSDDVCYLVSVSGSDAEVNIFSGISDIHPVFYVLFFTVLIISSFSLYWFLCFLQHIIYDHKL